MKKNLICIMICIAIGASAMAQQKAKPAQQPKPVKELSAEDIAKQRAERMRKELLLGNEQYDKVYKLLVKQAEKDIQRMKEAKAQSEALDKDMAKILNEAQLERYNDNKRPKFRRAMQRGRMPQMGRGRFCRFQPMHKAPKFGRKPAIQPTADSAKAMKTMPINKLRPNDSTGKAIEMKGDRKMNNNLYKIQEGENK